MEKDEILLKLKEIALKRLDLNGMGSDIIDLILEPVLDDIVKDSSNPYDDVAKAALYPILEKGLKDKLGKLLEKL